MLDTGLGRVHRILAGPPPAPSWYPAAGACYAPAQYLVDKASWLGCGAHPGRAASRPQLVPSSSVRCRLAGILGASRMLLPLLAGLQLPAARRISNRPSCNCWPAAGAIQARLAVLFSSGLCAVYDLDQQVRSFLLA